MAKLVGALDKLHVVDNDSRPTPRRVPCPHLSERIIVCCTNSVDPIDNLDSMSEENTGGRSDLSNSAHYSNVKSSSRIQSSGRPFVGPI